MRHDSDRITTRGRTFQNCTSGQPEVPDATRFLRLLIGLLIASNTQKHDQSMSTYGNWRPIGNPIAANKINRESLVMTVVSRFAVTQKMINSFFFKFPGILPPFSWKQKRNIGQCCHGKTMLYHHYAEIVILSTYEIPENSRLIL